MKAQLLLVAATAAVLAGCGREEHTVAVAPAPAASAPAAQASAPAGPIIAPAPAVAPVTDAQRQAGAQLASQGVQGAPACNGCHGAQGEGNPAMGSPRIAGQSRMYLLHELESYAQGSRKHPVMQPIASALNADQRGGAAAYFASLAPLAAPAGAASAAGAASGPSTASSASAPSTASTASAPSTASTASSANVASTASTGSTGRSASAGSSGNAAGGSSGRGMQLATVGDNSKGVQGCANCHGPAGIGSGDLYPYLAGQHASYLTATLGAWRDGSRANDPTGQMPEIAKALTPEDVSALAAYYAAQAPRPQPVGAERMAAAAAAASAPAVVSGPQSATPATMGSGGSGAGTEQGAATTGGSQGPGGGGATGAQSNGQPVAPAAGASAAR